MKFRPNGTGDVRLRYTDKRFEVVCKDGGATSVARKEVTIPLKSKEEVDNFAKLFKALGYPEDPSWVTHRKDLEHEHEGHTYSVCLQHTENFARILEVEIIANDKEEEKIHEPKIRAIISSLGCAPIDNQEFKAKIKKYIEENKVK